MADVAIATPSGDMPAYVARPAGPGPWPGVVVIHDAFGAGDNLERHADWLGEAGYLTVAPDLFHWNRKFTCLRATMREVAARRGRSFDDVAATRAWLKAQPDCSGRIGVIGFCMGGAFAMLLAPSGDYDAAAPNYGKVPTDADRFFSGACPVVGSFGRRDPLLRGAARTLEHALALNGVVHDVKEYPEASHGFLDDHTHDKIPLPVVILRNIFGAGYRPDEAADAKRRITAFFDHHLAAARA